MAGVYIHIPFCRKACTYCNFYFTTSLRLKHELIAALVKEISITPGLAPGTNEIIETIYLGGGTPSLLHVEDLQQIFKALQERFIITADAEMTIEINPDDILIEKLIQWKELGINRLSVGIQSFNEEELRWMNRTHTAADSLACIDRIRKAGFANFSVDIIYGSPMRSDDELKRDIELLIEKKIPHISCYALTVEPKTALAKMITLGKTTAVDPDRQASQFLLLIDMLNKAGYEHYEISNFSLPGMRSRHNSSYWQAKHYYGFGPSAHSFDGKSRCWNVADNVRYIDSLKQNIIPSEVERLTPTQRLNEYIMTSLRTMEGLDLDKINNEFGKDTGDKLQQQALKWEISKKLINNNSKLILTTEGKLFADGIAADLFFIEEH